MKIYSVSEITRQVRALLEDNFSDVWIEGEISNFRPAASGHFYFSLKDDQAQIRAVMFRGSNLQLRFRPENGLQAIAYGRVTVYEPRGEYQILVETLEPKGIGALQLAFEQLKKKLEAEGLFGEERKRPLPFMPRKIGIVTSPAGAVIRDMIHVLSKRFPNVSILLDPVSVQGDGAASEIAGALRRMGERGDLDVLIVARGGGSLEDLWAFNEEEVARAIAASPIPVISAVGHETDFTIADFVADFRAPTPSAAAAAVVPIRDELLYSLGQKRRYLRQAMERKIENLFLLLKRWESYFRDPGRRLTELFLRLDHLRERVESSMDHRIQMSREKLTGIRRHLDSLNPLAILERGYAVVTGEGSAQPLRRARDVKDGDRLKIRLYEGDLSAVASLPHDPRQIRKV